MKQNTDQTSVAPECRGGICKPWKLAGGCPPCLLVWGGIAVYMILSWLLQ